MCFSTLTRISDKCALRNVMLPWCLRCAADQADDPRRLVFNCSSLDIVEIPLRRAAIVDHGWSSGSVPS